MTTLASICIAATFVRPMERVATMDNAFATAVYDSHAVQLVYEPPLEVDYGVMPYRLVAGYCELPTVSEDGLEYRFRVRAGGSAQDMVRSLERLRDPAVVSPNGWIVKDVDTIRVVGVGGEGAAATRKVGGEGARPSATLETASPVLGGYAATRKVGGESDTVGVGGEGDNKPTTTSFVVIRLKRRCHFFPWLMAMSPAGVRRSDGTGTGEYELVSWRKNHEMVFRRRHPVTDGFDTVRYLVIDDPTTQWLMFLKGELSFMDKVSQDNWDSVLMPDGRLNPILGKMGVRYYSRPTMEVFHIGINMKDPVLGTNRKLRQALNAAFDYQTWEKYFNRRILPCTTPVPPQVEGALDTPFAYAYDIEHARRLLVEAGYPGGLDPKTGRRLTLTVTIGRASHESREAAELLSSFYARVGIRLEHAFLTWNAFLKAVNEGRTQMFRMGWVGDYPDAHNFLQLFYSKNVNPGPNHSAYANDEFDREYEAALDAAGSEERNAHWRRCQEILREDCPWVFTHINKAHALVRPEVGNFRMTDFPYGAEKYYRYENTVH